MNQFISQKPTKETKILRCLRYLLLIAGFWLLSSILHPPSSAFAASPVLTITAPVNVMIQDSTNLVEWQDVIVTSELTVLASDPQRHFRGRVTRADVTLNWAGTNSTKIYYGRAPGDYRQYVADCTNTVTITVIEPSPMLYFSGTTVTAMEEGDFGNEIAYVVPRPPLAVRKN